MKAGKSRNKPTDFGARLREAGLRRTGSRIAVLERLQKATSPLSHAQLSEDLTALSVDRATVYRNLMDLAEAGLVERRDLGDHVWRFELRGDGAAHAQQHPHLVCTDCGSVSCLEDVEVKVKVARGSRLDPDELEVQLKGRCTDCAA